MTQRIGTDSNLVERLRAIQMSGPDRERAVRELERAERFAAEAFDLVETARTMLAAIEGKTSGWFDRLRSQSVR